MQILFTRFPLESAHGGAEVQTLSLMQGLAARGHAVAFLGSCPVLLGLCRERGIPYVEHHIGAPPVTKWGVLSFAWCRRKMQAKLRAAFDAFQHLDAVVMLSLSEKLLLTAHASSAGTQVLWLEHDRVGRWLRSNPWLPELRKLSALATTVTVSDLSRDIYIELGWSPASVVSIPNGIDLARFARAATRNPQPATRNSQLRVGCVARLSADKGVDLLIDAVADVPEADLTIVGSGREEVFLRKLIDERGIADRARILPRVDDLGVFYADLDVLVLPSREHDPFGLVAAEAMALGIPVIVTDACGIVRHIAAGKEALVTPAENAPALADALRTMMDTQTRQMIGEAGKRAAEERFSLETMVHAYERLMPA